MTKQEIAQRLQREYKQYGKVDANKLNNNEYDFYMEILEKFGAMWRALRFANIPQKVPVIGITKEECIEELRRLQKEHGKVTTKIIKDFSFVSVVKFHKTFGSLSAAKEEAGIASLQPKIDKRERIIKCLQDMYKADGRVDSCKLKTQYSGIYRDILREYNGGLWRALKDAGIQQDCLVANLTKPEAIEELQRLYKKHGKVTKDIIDEYGIMSSSLVGCLFGGIQAALVEAGIEKRVVGQRKNISKEELDAEILRLVARYGYISKPMMEKHSTINYKVVNRIYGGFKKMYDELGVPHSKNGRTPTDEELIDEYLRICSEFGEVTQDIITQESEYSTTCYKDRFGSLNKLREKLGMKPNPNGVRKSSKTAAWCIKKYEKFLKRKAVKEKSFPWLKNEETGKKLRIDAYFEDLKVGIEYNGPQHYINTPLYYKNKGELEHRQKLDKLKIELCKQHGIKIISIKYDDKVTNDYIKQSLS